MKEGLVFTRNFWYDLPMYRIYSGLAQLAYLLQWLITFFAITAIIYIITAGIPYVENTGSIAKAGAIAGSTGLSILLLAIVRRIKRFARRKKHEALLN